MIELSGLVGRILGQKKTIHNDSWLGFHRLTPSEAALVLARMHSYVWHDLLFVMEQV